MKILDVGCGINKFEKSIGIDNSDNSLADVIHDLNVFPYPFPDDEFDLVYCRDVLEHLDNIMSVMTEIYRILKPAGMLKIVTPHYTSDNSYTDPTHRHHFSVRSFDYFILEKDLAKGIYAPILFEELNKRIRFKPLPIVKTKNGVE
jgi:predicted SAM-dependent methyltransferase